MRHLKHIFLTAFFTLTLTLSAQSGYAQCSSGGTVVPGGCASYSYQGCCEDNNTVRWCENQALCEIQCDVIGNQLPSNSCCEPSIGGYAGCCDKDVWDCVCGFDSYCCTFPWDASCANTAVTSGCTTCPSACPAAPLYCGWNAANSIFGCVDIPGQTSPTGDYTCVGGGGTCTPNCANKECGSDGCSSTCGTCPAGQQCNALYQCVDSGGSGTCVPTCAGKACGDDGCGELSCGSCGIGKVCSPEFQCIDCIPECGDRECGADGCGGQCGFGFCGTGEDCSEFGFCIEEGCTPYCPNKQCGDDGCGGKCGICSDGFECDETGKCLSESGEVQPEAVADAGGSTTPEQAAFPGGGTWVNTCPPGQVEQYGACVTPAHTSPTNTGRPGGDIAVDGCTATATSTGHARGFSLLIGFLLFGVLRRRQATVSRL